MKYMLFGAGSTGIIALHYLGYDRVECFVDNKRFGEEEQGKDIISFDEMLDNIQKEDVIVVASEKYYNEIEQQLLGQQIYNYFVFHEVDQKDIIEVSPQFPLYGRWETVSYTKCLSDYHINQYKRIAIYGVNPFTHYLLLEVAFQNSWSSIIGIIGNEDETRYTFGIPFVNLDDIWDSIDCLIINVKRKDSPIREIFEKKEHKFRIVDIYKIDQFNNSFYYPELKKYKDIHKGKRVFLIGNGPSLKIEDLDTLYKNKEICFAFNRIYRIYNQTKWRPNYLGITDTDMVSDCYEDLEKMDGEVFLGDFFCRSVAYINFPKVNIVHLERQEYYPNYPDFSDDISERVCWGCTVTYDIGLQIAAYMGFVNIYLLGMDHSIVGNISDERNHFISDYYMEKEKNKYNKRIFEKNKLTKAYEKAEAYSRQHGFRIYNATRGGELEVFERVDFDSLF